MSAADRDLGNLAVDHVPVHRIQRLFEPSIYEPYNLTMELRNERGNRFSHIGWVLVPFSVAFRYLLKRRDKIAFRIEAGVVASTFEERAGNTVSVFWNSGTNVNCYWAKSIHIISKLQSVAEAVSCCSGAALCGCEGS